MKRWIIGACLVLLAWYSGVVFFIPKLLCGPAPILPDLARGALMASAKDACLRVREFARINDSESLRNLEAVRGRDNQYIVTGLPYNDITFSGVAVYPRYHKVFREQALYRILFLDWSVHAYPTFVLTADGTLYRNESSGFDSRHPPTDVVLEQLGESHGWSFERRLSLTPPCE